MQKWSKKKRYEVVLSVLLLLLLLIIGTGNFTPPALSIDRRTVRKISVPTLVLYEIHFIAFTHALMVTSRSPGLHPTSFPMVRMWFSIGG